jgi:signal transduction histidine kinase
VLADGRYFGNLCAIDPRPAKVSDPKIVSMFNRFAQLIALQLENEMARAREHAALLDERAVGELREQFIAILGHDLRNPLQAFFAGCDFLLKKADDAVARDVVQRMKSNAKRMSALINDVLDFARGRLGDGFAVNLDPTDDLNESLAAVVRELQDARQDRTIIAEIHIDRAVCCDAARVQQLASNLLGNALAHGAEGSMVRFTATVAGDDLLVEVWNEGEPIGADNMSRIFAPFWRRSTAVNREGLGLGLHICSQIVKAHRGQLTVTSTQEGGTTFKATIPCSGDRDRHVTAD